MTAMPYAHLAEVGHEKVMDYLLNLDHPDGRHKARVFIYWGYTQAAPQLFVADLMSVALAGRAEFRGNIPHGRLYRVTGAVQTPMAGPRELITLWLIKHGSQAPRLVSAYPGRRR